jgi:hypothetical protein
MVGTDPETARYSKMVGGSTLLFLPITDIYADPGTDQAAERRIETATQEGLKYNVNAEHILYVTADELLEGLYEPGEFY